VESATAAAIGAGTIEEAIGAEENTEQPATGPRVGDRLQGEQKRKPMSAENIFLLAVCAAAVVLLLFRNKITSHFRKDEPIEDPETEYRDSLKVKLAPAPSGLILTPAGGEGTAPADAKAPEAEDGFPKAPNGEGFPLE
jgi:hypothetical protein